ncbi:MAG: hypothetical protein Fur005_34410 [Roseiflexaceae bacterium]
MPIGEAVDQLETIEREEAANYLSLRRDQHLMHLGSLLYDPLRTISVVRRKGQIAALALLVIRAGALPDPRPTVMVSANDAEALQALIRLGDWPSPSVWAIGDADLLPALEQQLNAKHNPARGLVFFGAEAADQQPLPLHLPDLHEPGVVVRQLTEADQTLDMNPCLLSAVSLRGWLQQGWRVFGAIQDEKLLAHALAAYPIGDADEVSAVYTAISARRHGLGAAAAAAVITDARQRGRRAFYIASRVNTASQRLAARIGLRQIGQTWEVVSL